ncbi:urea transporter [Mucilaginibacter gotjawali]|uniref:Urea transporter n=1 Tax=Mucilaginibacter gotjawali TaxID=1550579 RepID=A0A839SHF5_9SPHI|nr:urea transporter [Mucilaginibacter gotjawali]MBB3056733.1 urea transporter [Mucilaginibacter gotjawali]
MKNRISSFIGSILNTYAILFFSQNKVLGGILLLVSFVTPIAGLSGLFCALFSLIIIKILGYRHENIQSGLYSFNSLLLGLAFGTFFNFTPYYVLWLVFACLLVVMLTIILTDRLGKLGLPILSIPFILCYWLVLFGEGAYYHGGLQQKNALLLIHNAAGTGCLVNVYQYLSVGLPCYVCLFFRALSAVLFQNNILTGLLISIGVFIHSRIMFSLLVIGFISALLFNTITHNYPDGISYYNLGANFMLATATIGSFFLIPSARSYLWAILSVPVMFIITNALGGIMAVYNLPVFALPFCVINITLLYFLLLRKKAGKLQLVGLQHYSPERNLYQFLNQKDRLDDLKYFRFSLPFMGSWTVSQGYNGDITHKGEWGKALDFVIEDDDKKTYSHPGNLPEHFYCFNKPVLACGDGVVANVVDHVEDNAIGEANKKENWGNTVVIKHLNGLYSKVSHLKKGSIKVKVGDVVKTGDLIGRCGSSGRSPEPHLHFQVQATAYIDAKTLAYPFAFYMTGEAKKPLINSYKIPEEGQILTPPAIHKTIRKALDFQPGYTAVLSANTMHESIEVFTDESGQCYLYSKETGAAAYFINNGTQFYFTSFYGDTNSLLYYFHLAAYKVIFINDEGILANDVYPVHLCRNKIQLWLQDLIAPFYRFIKLSYQSSNLSKKAGIIISVKQFKNIFGTTKQEMDATIDISETGILEFNIHINKVDIKTKWVRGNIY